MTRGSPLAMAGPRNDTRGGKRERRDRTGSAFRRMTASASGDRASRTDRRITKGASAGDRRLRFRVAVCPAAVALLIDLCGCERSRAKTDAEKKSYESRRHPLASHARAVSTDLAKRTASTPPSPASRRTRGSAREHATKHPAPEARRSNEDHEHLRSGRRTYSDESLLTRRDARPLSFFTDRLCIRTGRCVLDWKPFGRRPRGACDQTRGAVPNRPITRRERSLR